MTTMAGSITESSARGGAAPAASAPVRRLDDLLDLEHAELAALYAQAALPRIEAIHGDLRGRMLAVPALPDRVTALPRAWARTQRFPWRGKSFWPVADGRGEGKNRVVSDRFMLFRFTTSVGASHDDGRDAVLLDYDHAENPFFIRAIEDEIRELRPGLYLGQAWLRFRGRATFSPASAFGLGRRRPSRQPSALRAAGWHGWFVLWFALEAP